MDIFMAIVFGAFMGVITVNISVTENEWTKAQELCKNNGGLSAFSAEVVGAPRVTCTNGAKFTINE